MQSLGGDAKRYFESLPGTRDARYLQNPGFLGLDLATNLDDVALRARLHDFAEEHLRLEELHPDVWLAAIAAIPARNRCT